MNIWVGKGARDMKWSRLAGLLGLSTVLLASSLMAYADSGTDRVRQLEEEVQALLDAQQGLKEQQALQQKQIADLQAELRAAREQTEQRLKDQPADHARPIAALQNDGRGVERAPAPRPAHDPVFAGD